MLIAVLAYFQACIDNREIAETQPFVARDTQYSNPLLSIVSTLMSDEHGLSQDS